VTESGVSGCCAIYWNIQGTTMIRGLGFVRFTGSYADVTLYLSQQSRRVLYLELAAPKRRHAYAQRRSQLPLGRTDTAVAVDSRRRERTVLGLQRLWNIHNRDHRQRDHLLVDRHDYERITRDVRSRK
jgi:hypothetical protein